MSRDEKETIGEEEHTTDAARKPISDSEEELTETELDKVAGGSSYSPEVR